MKNRFYPFYRLFITTLPDSDVMLEIHYVSELLIFLVMTEVPCSIFKDTNYKQFKLFLSIHSKPR